MLEPDTHLGSFLQGLPQLFKLHGSHFWLAPPSDTAMALRLNVLANLSPDCTSRELSQALALELQEWTHQPRLATFALKYVSREGSATTVVALLDAMQLGRVEVNHFHYGVGISACELAGDWMLAFELLRRMQGSVVLPDVVCLNAAVSVCEKAAQWLWAITVLNSMHYRRVSPDVISHNAALGACARAGEWESALQVLRQMWIRKVLPDVITFSSAMTACAKCSQWSTALSLLGLMQEQHVLPNQFSYASAMTATTNSALWQHTLHMFRGMVSEAVLADNFVYSTVITACDRGDKWDLAVLILGKMVRESLRGASAAFNGAISACATGAQWKAALSLLSCMPERQLVSCNAAMNACGRASAWQQSLLLLKDIVGQELRLDEISYNSAISACGEGGNWEMALVLLTCMKQSRIPPSEISFTSALSATANFAHWQMCTALLDLMGDLDQLPTADTFGIALSACEASGAWEAALAFLKNLMALQMVPDALHVGSAANTIRKIMGAKSAMDLLETMREVWRLHSETGSSSISSIESIERLTALPSVTSHPTILGAGHGVMAAMKPDDVSTEDFVEQLSRAIWPGARSNEVCTIVSRLDRPTSGVLPLALGPAGSLAANWLQSQFASRLVQKTYICLCEGPSLGTVNDIGVVNVPLQVDQILDDQTKRTQVSETGREALTKYRVLARYTFSKGSKHELMLLSVKPVTGRTHQIRVHMAHLNCPIVGDTKYGRQSPMLSDQRLFLHCRRIRLRDLSGKPFFVKARLPEELRCLLASLKPFLQSDSGDLHGPKKSQLSLDRFRCQRGSSCCETVWSVTMCGKFSFVRGVGAFCAGEW